jgi:hypothetical protein
MDLITEPEDYTPSLNDNGEYIDNTPSNNSKIFKIGMRCPCGTRKDIVFTEPSKFKVHIKCKKHQEWLKNINDNRFNYIIENKKAQETIMNQRQLIVERDTIIRCLVKEIAKLEVHLKEIKNPPQDLLDIDL